MKEENRRLARRLEETNEVYQEKKTAVEKQDQTIENFKKIQKENQDKLRATQNEIKLSFIYFSFLFFACVFEK